MLPLFVAIEAKNIPACNELLQYYTEQQLRHHRKVRYVCLCVSLSVSVSLSLSLPVSSSLHFNEMTSLGARGCWPISLFSLGTDRHIDNDPVTCCCALH